MELAEVKQADIAKNCPLDGVKVTEVRIKDAYTTLSLTLTDAAGHIMVIAKGGYSEDIDVFVKAPPRKVTKYRLVGELFTGSIGLEVKIDETFDDRTAAETRKNGMESHGASLTLTEVEVEVPDE